MTPQLVVVTDPMCSWCWGMAADLEDFLGDTPPVPIELMLGGINTHGTQPIGDYGRRYLMRLWREVEATTGQPFGYRLPPSYVHNSAPACAALEWLRGHGASAKDVFTALHVIQEAFFVQAADVTAAEVLAELLAEFGATAQDIVTAQSDPAIRERLRFQFDSAGAYGTNAMPSLLVRRGHELKLLAGGYVDAAMMRTLIAELNT